MKKTKSNYFRIQLKIYKFQFKKLIYSNLQPKKHINNLISKLHLNVDNLIKLNQMETKLIPINKQLFDFELIIFIITGMLIPKFHALISLTIVATIACLINLGIQNHRFSQLMVKLQPKLNNQLETEIAYVQMKLKMIDKRNHPNPHNRLKNHTKKMITIMNRIPNQQIQTLKTKLKELNQCQNDL